MLDTLKDYPIKKSLTVHLWEAERKQECTRVKTVELKIN